MIGSHHFLSFSLLIEKKLLKIQVLIVHRTFPNPFIFTHRNTRSLGKFCNFSRQLAKLGDFKALQVSSTRKKSSLPIYIVGKQVVRTQYSKYSEGLYKAEKILTQNSLNRPSQDFPLKQRNDLIFFFHLPFPIFYEL